MTNNFHFPRSAYIGFDNIMKQLESVAQHAKDAYPPYNVLQTEENKYQIELAVAGFSKDDLDIEIKDHILTVNGGRERKRSDDMFIHRGISSKKFSRSFRLSEYTEVAGADLQNGILVVNLEVVLPKEEQPTKVRIG